MREPLDDPGYQVMGIHIGDSVFVADRVLIKDISYVELERAMSDRELDWLLNVAQKGDFNDHAMRNQLRSLWTAYAMHNALDINTPAYDERLHLVFETIVHGSRNGKRFDYEAFGMFMGEYI